MNKVKLAICACSLALASNLLSAQSTVETDDSWQEIVNRASGQTVYWNAWGGADNINDYIQWVADKVEARYQIQLEHVKLTDTAHAVSRVLAEKVAGETEDGAIDLIWINGENFRAMKDGGLLYGPFSESLPNYRAYVSPHARQSLTQDFGTPVDGMESPWGMAQVVFMYDTATLSTPPKSMEALLAYAKDNPGRITYPQPPQFLGSTFLKQALIDLTPNPERLLSPVERTLVEPSAENMSDFQNVTAPLWAYLDQLHQVAWRSGKAFPDSAEHMMRLLDDQEIDIALSFDVSAASVQITQGNLPDTVRTYVFDDGTIGNTHFVAIPFNSNVKEAAQVVANFLLSPEAQIEKQHPNVWGDLSVLDYQKLPKQAQLDFDHLPKGVATLSLEQLGKTLPEPHVSWMEALENEWRRRYGH